MDGQKNNQVKIYGSQSARTKRVNRFLFVGGIVLDLLIFGLMMYRTMESNGNFALNVAVLVLCGLNVILKVILFKANSVSEKYRYIVMVGHSVVYSLILFIIPEYYITMALLFVLIGTVMYFDKKFTSVFAIYMLLINIARTIFLIISEKGSGVFVDVAGLVIVAICAFILVHTVRIGGKFIADMVGSAQEERKKTDNLLIDVLGISNSVQENIDKVSHIIGELNNSTATVNTTVEEIANSTSSVTQSVIEQSDMTESIQNDISDTANASASVVEIVKHSYDSIENIMKAFRQLQDQSLEIATVNNDVAIAMGELQEKANAVNDIVGTIVNISSQTNLLALNASIEAARAGEAGRGFAVVADEIRSLAEETRQSTEHINKILGELNSKAAYASEIVNNSIDVTAKQSESISGVSSSMDEVNAKMNDLSIHSADINNKVIAVSNSNRSVVDHITQVSSVCQEITASTENAAAVTNQSEELAEEAVRILNEVLEISRKLETI